MILLHRSCYESFSFETYEMNIDLSKFNQVDLEEENYKSTFRMQKIDQLKVSIDTLQLSYTKEQNVFSENFGKKSTVTKMITKSGIESENDSIPSQIFQFIETDEHYRKSMIMDKAISIIKIGMRDLNSKRKVFFSFQV